MKIELTYRVKNGDGGAFNTFYEREYKKAYFYAFQYLMDNMMAEDIVQDSFITIWEKRDSLDTSFPLQPYLYSIIKNKSINKLSRLSIDKRVKDELLRREYKVNMNALKDDSSDVMIINQLRERINKIYSEIPPKYAEIFMESRLDGMSYKEIAEKRGITVKSVEYKIAVVLKLFKERLKDFLLVIIFLSGIWSI